MESAQRYVVGDTILIERARLTAERILANALPMRWVHSQAVARRAEEVAQALPPGEGEVLVAAAWVHDVGYTCTLAETGMHQLDGARFLARQGFPLRMCALVAHHSGAGTMAELAGLSDELAMFEDERGPVRDALWYCDAIVGQPGRPVTPADRRAEMRAHRQLDHLTVRAMALNEPERTAAARRTEELLRHRWARDAGVTALVHVPRRDDPAGLFASR